MNTRKIEAILEVCNAYLDTIRTCPDGVPSGHLYAVVQGTITLDQHLQILQLLVDAQRITVENHLCKATQAVEVEI